MKVHYRGQRGEGVYDVAFEGLIKNVQRKYRETGSEVMKQEYEQFMRITPCETCKGQRLKAESLAVTVADKNIYEMTSMSVKNLNAFLAEMKLGEQQHRIGDQILKEIRARVGFLNEVGLDYLSLSRATGTLSGGEHSVSVWQRRSVPGWSGLRTFWTSRRSDCISAITISCWGR